MLTGGSAVAPSLFFLFSCPFLSLPLLSFPFLPFSFLSFFPPFFLLFFPFLSFLCYMYGCMPVAGVAAGQFSVLFVSVNFSDVYIHGWIQGVMSAQRGGLVQDLAGEIYVLQI